MILFTGLLFLLSIYLIYRNSLYLKALNDTIYLYEKNVIHQNDTEIIVKDLIKSHDKLVNRIMVLEKENEDKSQAC